MNNKAGFVMAILSILGGICELASWAIGNKYPDANNIRRISNGHK